MITEQDLRSLKEAVKDTLSVDRVIKAAVQESYLQNEQKPTLSSAKDGEVKSRERNTFLLIIGGLLHILTEPKSESERKLVFGNQSAVIAELGERFDLKESTLKGKFAAANTTIRDHKKSK